tara:strand:+ start:1025 stop:1738 length:714 start_codon:yes stop_codon:yes gene_type:complete
MNKKIKIIALLTGKGGSGLKNKNIIKIKKIPLCGYPCKEAKKIKLIDEFYASSEDKKILNVTKKYGFKTILRPKTLSKKNSLHRDVLMHAINHFKKKKIYPEIIVVLLANSATIKAKWIADCLKKLMRSKQSTACVPVINNNDHHPFRAKKINNNGYLNSFFKFTKKISSNRQDLPDNFFLAHNFWCIKTESILTNKGQAPWNFLGKNVIPYKIKSSIDIHEKDDVLLTNNWLNKNG